MKTALLDIIGKQLHSKPYKDDVVKFSTDLIDFYESQRESTQKKFIKFLEKYNFESMADFSEYTEYPHVTLLHGSGGFEFWPVIDYDGGVTDTDKDIGTIIIEPEIYLLEDNFDKSVQDEIIDLAWDLRHVIVFVFLCTVWQEIKGYQYGILVKTLENNSVRQFIFNDLSWQNLSEYGYYKNKEKRLPIYFNRDLTEYEILQRVKSISYPVNPYQNKWRKFEKEETAIEIAAWGNEVGIRENSEVLKIINTNTLEGRLLWEQKKSTALINEDFTEVFYENHKEKIHPKAIEFDFHSGTAWYDKELKNRLDEEALVNLEEQLNIKLPFFFREYLRLLNGRKFNKYRSLFIKPDMSLIKITEFYNVEELYLKNSSKTALSFITNIFNKQAKEPLTWLKVANSNKGEIEIGVSDNNKGLLRFENENDASPKISFEALMSRAKG